MSDAVDKEHLELETEESVIDEWQLMQTITDETLKIKGVSRFAVSLTDNLSKNLLGRDTTGQGIKITWDEDKEELRVDIHIFVRYGINIPAISFEIQTNVKSALEELAGFSVEAVNVHIEGIDKPFA